MCSCINPLHLRVCVCSYASFQPHSLSELLFHTAEPDTDVSLRAHEPLTHKLRTDTVLLMPNTGVLREEHCCIMQSLWNYCRKTPAKDRELPKSVIKGESHEDWKSVALALPKSRLWQLIFHRSSKYKKCYWNKCVLCAKKENYQRPIQDML